MSDSGLPSTVMLKTEETRTASYHSYVSLLALGIALAADSAITGRELCVA